MEYRVEGRVPNRSGPHLPIAAVAGALLLIVAAASWGAERPSSPTPTPTQTATPLASPSDAPAARTGIREGQPAPRPARLPAVFDCRGLDARLCQASILAAMRTLPGRPAVAEATAWRSALCSDSIQCPASLLADHHIVGSVTLTLAADGSQVWMNVLATRDTRLAPGASRLMGYTVRWLPAPSAPPAIAPGIRFKPTVVRTPAALGR